MINLMNELEPEGFNLDAEKWVSYAYLSEQQMRQIAKYVVEEFKKEEEGEWL